MATPSILVIEDEEYLRDLYSEILCNYTIETVEDGLEALKKDRRYDLYIVDIGLPRMDGLQTIEKIKEIHGNIRTMVVTGHDIVRYTKRLEDNEVTGVLQKPFKVFDLITTVEKVLEG